MKNKTSILLITLLALSGLMVLATMPVSTQADEGSHTVYIGAVNGDIAFNETSINLEPNTEYTIVFVNPDTVTPHNLRIDINNDVEDSGNVDDPNDITVGLDNNDAAGVDGSWSATWTTPAAGEFVYYCGYSGHYSSGMFGTFIVGEGATDEEGPGFGAFAGIAALLVAALAIPQIRKR